MYRCNCNFRLCIIMFFVYTITCDFAKFYLKFAQSQRRKGGNVSVCFSYTLIWRPLDLQAFVCSRGAGVTGCLGDRLIRLLRPSSSFRAIYAGALLISLAARVLLKWLYSRC